MIRLAAVVFLVAAPVFAQDLEEQEQAPPAQDSPELPFTQLSLDAGYFHVFDLDIDGGGSFSRNRGVVSLGGNTILTPESNVRWGVGYRFDGYDFSGASSLGVDPWSDIHTITAGGIYGHQLDDEWSLFGGPFLQLAFEGGADIDRSIMGGVLGGASYRFSDKLTLGIGAGVTTQIEDSARIFPVLVVNWKLSDEWAIVNAPNYTGFSRQSFEIAWDMGAPEHWLLAFGLSYEFNRFRLDDSGVAPNGVGEDEAINAWVRLVYRPTPKLAVTGLVGVVIDGRIALDDSNGNRLGSRDYANGPFVGIAGRIAF